MLLPMMFVHLSHLKYCNEECEESGPSSPSPLPDGELSSAPVLVVRPLVGGGAVGIVLGRFGVPVVPVGAAASADALALVRHRLGKVSVVSPVSSSAAVELKAVS